MSVRPSVDKTLKHIEHNRNQTKPDEFIEAEQYKAKHNKKEKSNEVLNKALNKVMNKAMNKVMKEVMK